MKIDHFAKASTLNKAGALRFFFSSRRGHTRLVSDWSSDVCSSDLRHGVPRVVVSGRLSARAARRYAWISWLLHAMLAEIDAFAMQTDADAARVIGLGAPAERVHVRSEERRVGKECGTRWSPAQ